MDSNLLAEYRALRQKREDLEFQEGVLKEQIVAALHKEGTTKVENDNGTFTIASRTSYKYSDKVKALEEKVKLAKVKEEQKGTATPSVTTFLVYTAPKTI